ncbi:hypothetical protein CP8484711_2214, partial [Chlamydia psittaci 84-8471/1]
MYSYNYILKNFCDLM